MDKRHNVRISISICVYVTAELDISAGTVPAGPNLTGGMDPALTYGNLRDENNIVHLIYE